MKSKLTKLITSIAMMIAISLPSFAHDFEVDGIYYNILSESDKTVEVTCRGEWYDSYTNEYTGRVTIPETVTYSGKTYSVTSIGGRAFDYCSGLTSVTIPNTVTTIGDHAFDECSGLKSLSIPNSVTSIGNYAFGDCIGLTSVSIGNSVTSIGDYAFYYCSGLTSVTIPSSVTSIGNSAFYYCSGLTSVSIGNSVTSIGDYAFSGCSGLTSVTIPSSVTEIGNYAFYYCSGLTSINVESGNSNYDSRDKCNAIIETETNTLITGCQNTVIPNSVTAIGNYAFYNCSGLTSVTIPNSVNSIGKSAFYNCTGLTSVTIPKSVNSIGEGAFYECSGLTSVTIPNSVNSIGYAAFYNCSSLTELIIADGTENLSLGYNGSYQGLFYDCPLEKLYLGRNLSYYTGSYNGYSPFHNKTTLKEVTIGNSVTSIGDYAFRGCSGLTSVSIGNSVTSIGYTAFALCSGLTSVTIPNSVTSIGEGAFYECSGLKYVDYNAKNLLNVGESTNLSYAKFIIVGEEVETIPAGIIDSSAATTIISKNTIPPVCDSNAFSSVEKSKCTLYVPSASFMDYWSAEVWKEFTNIKPFTEVSEISFGSENYTIKVGESLQLETTIAPSNASISDLIWTSSNPEVATVSSSGKVVGIKLGEVTITAETVDGSNLAASCTITVETTLAESIKLSQTEVELAPYETVVLTYTILPANTTNKSVTWSSSDESIATFKVNNDGSATVLMLKDDKAVITVTTNDGSNLSASCVVGKSSGVEDVYVEEVVVTVEDGEIVVKNVTGIVTVYNITGIAVTSETANGNEVRFDNLQPGVYIVVVNNKSVKVVL